MSDSAAGTHGLAGEAVTWTGLLAHWTGLAQASLALPKNAEGDRWRNAVPAIVGLQAITHALGDLERLAPEEDRAVAMDRAAVGAQTHAATLHQLWKGELLHPELIALIDDARAALAAVRAAGVEWCVTGERMVVEHPAEIVDELLAMKFKGDLFLPVPGTVLFRGSPCGFARGPGGVAPPPEVTGTVRRYLNAAGGAAKHVPARQMRQVYRQFDFGSGRVVRDLVRPMSAELTAGQAQLVPAILAGVPQPVTLPIPGMANLDDVPVAFED